MTITQYIQLGLETIGALGALATVLSHCPLIPTKTQEFLARFGATSTRFAVTKKPEAL